MTDPDIIEIMAEGITDANDLDVTDKQRAESALRFLRSAGYDVVPVQPTEAMFLAGERAFFDANGSIRSAVAAAIAAAREPRS